jgi:uncharacterized damage-inducible protein DinB
MKAHFEQFAAYNRWANARLYEAALALDDAAYRRDVEAFFKSLHRTLNHLLLTDRIWLKRLTGEGEHPNRLDAIIYEDRCHLPIAQADEGSNASLCQLTRRQVDCRGIEVRDHIRQAFRAKAM